MKKILIPIFSATLFLAACGGEDTKKEETSKTASSDPGYELFQQKSCIGCHGKDLEGASGPALNKIGSKLSKDEIVKVIEEGKGSMPKGLAEGDDAQKIADYLSKQK